VADELLRRDLEDLCGYCQRAVIEIFDQAWELGGTYGRFPRG
jgi:hypothetical protein